MAEAAPNFGEFSDSAAEARLHAGCSRCGAGQGVEEETAGSEAVPVPSAAAVRFGYMRYIGEFSHDADVKFTERAKLVIQTQRGIEIGEHVALTCSGCDKSIKREQINDWVQSSGEDTYVFDSGHILREATAADLTEYAHIQATSRQKRELAQQLAERYGLPLKVVECECLFGGERIVFYFTAAERIDFRAMVKDLAKEFRTRIEMRQIGARDEARLLADYETCGLEVCCKAFLKTLKPVTMRMAKLQKATLDPSQVSGRCGRLKCCLRYEHLSYEQLEKQLPRMGVRVRTEYGEGVVTNRGVLTQLVQIRKDDDTLVSVAAEDIIAVNIPAPQPAGPQASAEKRPESPREPLSGLETSAAQPAGSDEEPDDSGDQGENGGQPEGDAEHPARRRRKRRRRRRRPSDGDSGGAADDRPPTAS